MRVLLVLVCCICVAFGCTNIIGPWTKKAPIPHMHQEGQPTQIVNKKLYIAAAYGTNDLETTTVVDIYDPLDDKWVTAASSTPFNSSHMQSATDGRYIYMVAGFHGKHPGPATRGVWKYDTQTDAWIALPSLPENRASGAVFLDNSKMLHYVGGLVDRLTNSDKHWVLDITATSAEWKEDVPFPMARNHMQAALVGDVAYFPGGQFGHDNNPQDQALFHSYNVTSRTWSRLPDLPRARSHAEPATFVANGRIIVMGGRYDAYPRHDDIIEYNPVAKTWANLGKLPTGLHINPSVVYFRGLKLPNEPNVTNFVVLTAGGHDYNDGQLTTWTAPVSFSCNDTRDPDLVVEDPPEEPVEPPVADPPTMVETPVTVRPPPVALPVSEPLEFVIPSPSTSITHTSLSHLNQSVLFAILMNALAACVSLVHG